MGQDLENFSFDGLAVTSSFKSGLNVLSDLLIAADRIRSTTRRLVLPNLRPRYAGYVAWRGVVEESEVPQDVLDVFRNSFTFYQMEESHIFCYLIPDEFGDTRVGHRRLNWVWYWNTSEAELDSLLTDTNGTRRVYAISPGAIKPELEQKQREIAEQVMPPVFKKQIRATKEPFVQAILDLGSPQLVFDRTILVGDASFILRPHTAAGTEKGVANAFCLAEQLSKNGSLSDSLAKWQQSEIDRGQGLMRYGQDLGDRSQRPKVTAGGFKYPRSLRFPDSWRMVAMSSALQETTRTNPPRRKTRPRARPVFIVNRAHTSVSQQLRESLFSPET